MGILSQLLSHTKTLQYIYLSNCIIFRYVNMHPHTLHRGPQETNCKFFCSLGLSRFSGD